EQSNEFAPLQLIELHSISRQPDPNYRISNWLASVSGHCATITQGMCPGQRVARCQVDQLGTPANKKNVEGDEDGVGPLARKSCEGRIDLTAGAGVEHLDL